MTHGIPDGIERLRINGRSKRIDRFDGPDGIRVDDKGIIPVGRHEDGHIGLLVDRCPGRGGPEIPRRHRHDGGKTAGPVDTRGRIPQDGIAA